VTATLAVELSGAVGWLPAGADVTVLANGDLRVAVPVGETVIVYGGAAPVFAVRMLVGNASEYNWWGMHRW
jgi:hypothetical protein